MTRSIMKRILMNPKYTMLMRMIGIVLGFMMFLSMVSKAATYNAFTVKVTGKGQPIILIPGATCSGEEWDATVARYAKTHQCHVFTLAGYAGTKPLPASPYLQTIRQQIEQYITDNKLNDVILIGHSIGGFLSLCIASDMKTHLKQVIVVDALPFFAGAGNLNAPDTFSKTQAEQLLAKYNGMSEKEMRDNQLQAAQFLCRDSTYWARIADWGTRSDKRTFAYTINEMLGNDMRQKISNIQVPVLVLAAYCAIPGYPSYSRDYVTALFTGQCKACTTCTVHVAEDNAKHFIMYDTPDWYFAEIDNFIAKK